MRRTKTLGDHTEVFSDKVHINEGQGVTKYDFGIVSTLHSCIPHYSQKKQRLLPSNRFNRSINTIETPIVFSVAGNAFYRRS
jgi:hypothetical protein